MIWSTLTLVPRLRSYLLKLSMENIVLSSIVILVIELFHCELFFQSFVRRDFSFRLILVLASQEFYYLLYYRKYFILFANKSTHKYGKTFDFPIFFVSKFCTFVTGLVLFVVFIYLFSFYRLSANDLLRFYDLCAIHDFDHNYAVDGLGHPGREVMLALCLKAFR